MKILDGLLITLGMYTIIPVPQRVWTEQGMRWTMAWFPLTGLFVSGGWLLLIWLYLTQGWTGIFITAALLMLWPIILTGGLHIDGLADTADALGSHRDRETRLRIMKDPTSGPSAILWTIAVLVLQLMAWLDLLAADRPITIRQTAILLLIPVISRILSGLGVVTLPPARRDGLVKTFRDGLSPAVLPLLIVLALVAAAGLILLDPLRGLVAVITAAVCFIIWQFVCRRSFGGITGDLAGFLLVITETALLMTQAMLP